ncbi:YceI family protein [Flammeovirgaceae bacterium SG7u.111]|nr:YceI family protein [Flammeovirgaceae bacterium SG7u.132]WPO34026.1 YceI family protein [Flammeovirgaceae bacterium SG7u.111]
MKLVKLSNLLLIGLIVSLISCSGAKKTEEVAETEEVAVVEETPAGSLEDGTYTYSAEDSKIKWHASKMTGDHNGTVDLASGSFTVEGGEVKGGSFDIDLNTIVSEDLAGKDEMKAKLEGHLKSADFFDVETSPMATFEISEVTADSVKGNLTIKNISNEIAFPATIAADSTGISTKASFKLDRTKWDMMFHSGLEQWGDKTIKDEFTVEFDLVATKDAVQ